jgi:hypothetical protein
MERNIRNYCLGANLKYGIKTLKMISLIDLCKELTQQYCTLA